MDCINLKIYMKDANVTVLNLIDFHYEFVTDYSKSQSPSHTPTDLDSLITEPYPSRVENQYGCTSGQMSLYFTEKPNISLHFIIKHLLKNIWILHFMT